MLFLKNLILFLIPFTCQSCYVKKTCNYEATTTTTTTTTSTIEIIQCSEINCVFGKKYFDPSKGCICICNTHFYGLICNLFNTSALSTLFDAVECKDIECNSISSGNCPLKCLCMSFFFFFLNHSLRNQFYFKSAPGNHVKILAY